jgi:hypothetical protein
VEQSCQRKGVLNTVMGQLPLENSNPLFILVEKGWLEKEVTVLTNEYFGPDTDYT